MEIKSVHLASSNLSRCENQSWCTLTKTQQTTVLLIFTGNQMTFADRNPRADAAASVELPDFFTGIQRDAIQVLVTRTDEETSVDDGP